MDVNTGQEPGYLSWVANFPDGELHENCASLSDSGGYNDIRCSAKYCFVCDLPRRAIVNVRGLCKDTKLDTRYVWIENIIDGYYEFRGTIHSFIRFNDILGHWTVSSKKNPDTYAVLEKSQSTYPLGRKIWTLHNDSCTEGEGETKVTLQVSICTEDQFTCNDGLCIPMDNRCNRRADCSDNSDEINCQTAVKSREYLKEYPPLGKTGICRKKSSFNLETFLYNLF